MNAGVVSFRRRQTAASRHIGALAAVLAVAGPFAAGVLVPGSVLAQTAPGSGQYGTPGIGDPTLAPGVGAALEPVRTDDDSSSVDTLAPQGSIGARGRADPTDAGQSAQSVSTDTPDGDNPTYLRVTPAERASRNYGGARSTGELSPVDYSNDDYTAARGKTALRPNRLGVFDQNYVDQRGFEVKPYIEAGQIVDAQFTPTHDVLTYSVAAAGVDAIVNGRNNQGALSLRYERRFGEGSGAGDSNSVTGIARLSSAIIPDTLRIDYGGYANRTNILGDGAALTDTATNADALTQVYSVYAGPSLAAHAGAVALTGHYRIGYTKIGNNFGNGTVTATTPAGTTVTAQPHVDIFDHSTVQDAKLAAGVRPGDALPIGLGVESGYYQEDVSNLAQRLRDIHTRAEVTVPVADAVALVGGIGYEDVKISSHNAVLDANGNPVLDGNGRYITDYSTPRSIAFDTKGLIWMPASSGGQAGAPISKSMSASVMARSAAMARSTTSRTSTPASTSWSMTISPVSAGR